jgi:hypothetical protein
MLNKWVAPCDRCNRAGHLQINTAALSYDELYMLLRLVDPFFLAKDLELVLRASNSLKDQGLSRAAWLLNAPRFQRWAQVNTGSSDLLLVNGHLGDYCLGKISPLSVLSATFASMDKAPSLITLTHFCGLHTGLSDPMNGCTGLMLSLVAQLVVYRQEDNNANQAWIEDALLEAAVSRNLGALCHLFQVLLEQVPPHMTVYCVIDDISQFETTLGGWDEELSYVVRRLQYLTRRRRGSVLKVLMTTAQRSIKVFRQLDGDDSISLSAVNRSPRSTQRLSLQNEWSGALSQSGQSLQPPGQNW